MIVMDDGRTIEQGHPREMFANASAERTRRFLSAIL
jgi:ABC-type polar amino acid transport system ATPase subunit